MTRFFRACHTRPVHLRRCPCRSRCRALHERPVHSLCKVGETYGDKQPPHRADKVHHVDWWTRGSERVHEKRPRNDEHPPL
jgi:hypothetical protein